MKKVIKGMILAVCVIFLVSIVFVEAIMDHGCVSARGIKASGITETTYMSPALRENTAARQEIQNKVKIARFN